MTNPITHKKANIEAPNNGKGTGAHSSKSTIPKVAILPGHFTSLIAGNINFQNKVQCNFEPDDGSLVTPPDYRRTA